MSDQISKELERAALGNAFFRMGQLYNAKKEKFCQNKILFSDLPNDFIESFDNKSSRTELNFSWEDTLKAKFDSLKIGAQFKISALLMAPDELSFSASYLNYQKDSKRNVSCTCNCSITTQIDMFTKQFSEMKQYVQKHFLEDEDCTHFVSKINWGAECFLIKENGYSYSSGNNEKEIKAALKAELTELCTGTGLAAEVGGNAGRNSLNTQFVGQSRMKYFADFIPGNINLDTDEDVRNFVSEFQMSSREANGGRGRQLSYVLTPITEFQDLFEYQPDKRTIVYDINPEDVDNIIDIFQRFKTYKQGYSEVITRWKDYENYLPSGSETAITMCKKSLEKSEDSFKSELVGVLPKARDPKLKASSGLNNLIEYYSKLLSRKSSNTVIPQDYLNVYERKTILIDKCRSTENLFYLEREKTLNEKMMEIWTIHKTDNFLVINISDYRLDDNKNLDQLNLFLSKARIKGGKKYFIIVDLDNRRLRSQEELPSLIVKYKNGKSESKILGKKKFGIFS